jgi:hypothetical protein
MMADRALGLVAMVCDAMLYLHCCFPFILPRLLSSCLLFNCVCLQSLCVLLATLCSLCLQFRARLLSTVYDRVFPLVDSYRRRSGQHFEY